MRLREAGLAILAATALAPTATHAQAQGDARLREALRTATAQVRTLEDERSRWQAREVELKAQLEKLKKEAGSQSKADAQLADLQRRLATQRSGAASSAEALQKCQDELKAQLEAAAAAEAERVRLAEEGKSMSSKLVASEERNRRTYQAAKDVLDWIDRLGWGAALAAREPFLGFKRVELENAAQDHRDKLLDARGTPGGSP